MKSNIEINGVPMIWVTADEDPVTGDLVTVPSTNEHNRDDLVPMDLMVQHWRSA